MSEQKYGQQSPTRPPTITDSSNKKKIIIDGHSVFWDGMRPTWIIDNIEVCLSRFDELLKQPKYATH